MKRISFARCAGLNTVAAPEDTGCNPKTGAWEASQAVNVDILDGGRRFRTLPGFVKIAEGAWRDTFVTASGRVYAVRDEALVEILDEQTSRFLQALTTPGRVAWAQLDDLVFWTNAVESGLLQEGEAVAWGGKTWPVASEADRFVAPPPGQALGAHGGRMWIGDGVMLHYTEGAGGWHFYQDAVSFFEMPGEVTMIRSVLDGLYVGTTAGVFFFAGTDPDRMTMRRVFPDAPILGLDVSVQADNFGRFDPVTAACWATAHDLCLGLPGGLVVQLIKDRVSLDVSASEGTLFLLPKRLVALFRP